MKWCLNHKEDLPDLSFYPDAPEKALCKACIRERRTKRNEEILKEVDRRKREQEALRTLISSLQTPGDPFVYLIEFENRYKIGVSKNIPKRIKNFNTAHASPCKIVAIIKGDKVLETELHERFATHRLNGEWFIKRPHILKFVANLPDAYVFLPEYLQQEANTQPCGTGAS
jgi:hypothetical protein